MSRLNLSLVAKALQGGECRARYGGRLPVGQVGWFQNDSIFRDAQILGKGSQLGATPEYLITWLKLRDLFADSFNLPRYVGS